MQPTHFKSILNPRVIVLIPFCPPPPPSIRREFATFGRQLTPLSPVTPSLFHAEWVVGGWRRFEKTCTEDPDCRGSGFGRGLPCRPRISNPLFFDFS